jgi:hypothetical protein
MKRSHHQTQHTMFTQGYKNTYILKRLNIRKYTIYIKHIFGMRGLKDPSLHQALI